MSETHHCATKMIGPDRSGGITLLKTNFTVNSVHTGPITGESNPGLDNMQLVFVYKAQAKNDGGFGKIQFKAPFRAALSHRSDRHHSFCIYCEQLEYYWLAGRRHKQRKRYNAFFHFSAPRLSNEDIKLMHQTSLIWLVKCSLSTALICFDRFAISAPMSLYSSNKTCLEILTGSLTSGHI